MLPGRSGKENGITSARDTMSVYSTMERAEGSADATYNLDRTTIKAEDTPHPQHDEKTITSLLDNPTLKIMAVLRPLRSTVSNPTTRTEAILQPSTVPTPATHLMLPNPTTDDHPIPATTTVHRLHRRLEINATTLDHRIRPPADPAPTKYPPLPSSFSDYPPTSTTADCEPSWRI